MIGIKDRNKKKTRVCFLFDFIKQKDGKMGKKRIFFARWTPAIYWSLVSKPVFQDIQSICYCLHTGTFRLDTRDLLVAGVPISISSKYLYLYLALKVLTRKPDLTEAHQMGEELQFYSPEVLSYYLLLPTQGNLY